MERIRRKMFNISRFQLLKCENKLEGHLRFPDDECEYLLRPLDLSRPTVRLTFEDWSEISQKWVVKFWTLVYFWYHVYLGFWMNVWYFLLEPLTLYDIIHYITCTLYICTLPNQLWAQSQCIGYTTAIRTFWTWLICGILMQQISFWIRVQEQRHWLKELQRASTLQIKYRTRDQAGSN